MRRVLLVTALLLGWGANMATIWEDDFSSGNALNVSYGFINDAETNATCGQGGGWGCRTTGSASEQYYGVFRYTPASPIESEYLRVVIDLDHAAANYDDVSGTLISLNDAAFGAFLSLYHGADTGDDKTVLWVQSGFELADGPFSATGAIELGTWQQITLEVWFSTYAAGSPWAPNADGRVRVRVDSTTVIDSDTLLIQSWHTSADGTPNVTNSVTFGPMGNGDNIGIYTADDWVDIANFVEQEISSSTYPGGSARVLGYLWSEDTGDSPLPTVQSRLYNVTDGVSVGESPTVQAATPTEADFAVTLTPGTKRYRQQVTSDLPEVDIFWSGRGVGP